MLHGYIILITVVGVAAGGSAMPRGRSGGRGTPRGAEQQDNIYTAAHTHTHTDKEQQHKLWLSGLIHGLSWNSLADIVEPKTHWQSQRSTHTFNSLPDT